jgi:hypothetical protein
MPGWPRAGWLRAGVNGIGIEMGGAGVVPCPAWTVPSAQSMQNRPKRPAAGRFWQPCVVYVQDRPARSAIWGFVQRCMLRVRLAANLGPGPDLTAEARSIANRDANPRTTRRLSIANGRERA